MNNILEIDSVFKSYNNQNLLSDVYLKCQTNEIIGLLGRNGSGKSTLLKIIFGIVSAENKFVRINGIVKSRTSQLLKDVSYLAQENFIPNHLSVQKAIQLAIDKQNLNNFYEDEIIQAIKSKNIKHLSGGELRFLEIKIILNNESKFALLDEPFNGLSPLQIEKVIKLIQQNASRKGIIITDHNYQSVLKVATKLNLLKSGKLNVINNNEELLQHGYIPNSQF